MQTPNRSCTFSLISAFHDLDNGLKGNISAVLLCKQLPDEKMMQSIAADFNQPATTFLTKISNYHFHVRWFAPDTEIGLCGHGSLAAAKFIFDIEPYLEEVLLSSTKGEIRIFRQKNNLYTIELDAIDALQIEVPKGLVKAFDVEIEAFYTSAGKNIVLLKSESQVKKLKPDYDLLRKLEYFGYAVTAPGDSVDFVSRTFVPKVAQLEDHATGSSHAVLTPFWSDKLNKTHLSAIQLSPRGGKFLCDLHNTKVHISGACNEIYRGEVM